MSNKDLIKASLLSKLPEGALRQLEFEGDEDRLWDGIAEAIEPAYELMLSLGEVREPDTVEDLAALEREYGFLYDENLTEAQRRGRIKALKYAKAGSGTGEALEGALQLAGFDLVVAEGRYLQNPEGMVPTESREYVVNGFEYLNDAGYAIGCQETEGPPIAYEYGCEETVGGPIATYAHGCEGLTLVQIPVTYTPTDNWHLVFFVAGEITLDGAGNVLSMTPASIARSQRQTIREIILRLKPLHTWAYLAVDWIDDPHWGFGFFPMGISPHGL